jgi:hypothetical protein
VLLAAALVAAVITGTKVANAADPALGDSAHAITKISLVAKPYKPLAQPGTTDDYHCILMNPHIKQNSYVISSQFFPGSTEDHHAVLYLIPPSLAANAERADPSHEGWTCFGIALTPDLPITPMLGEWAPGHGADSLPRGTGIPLPAGSLVIMQVHYNLLLGDRPVRDSLELDTVPASTPLLPLRVNTALAAPDIPCPAHVTGPLCNRAASLANQAARFGSSEAQFVNTVESMCGRNPSDPPAADTTSCTSPIFGTGYIVRVQAHMHLLGVSFRMVLNPGTSAAKTILDVPTYNFHYQKAYNLVKPVAVTSGDRLQITCSYDPALAQELPILRSAPPHFVTWGDGSSDEMCVGLAWISQSLPNPHSRL